ncbi:MAG: vitamin B12 dependent-methionine synthase activation domain-containing protein, partial [Candidatus Hydrogenedentota bacterium]
TLFRSLLKSADVMKQVMGFLEEYMKVKSGADLHSEIQYKGTIVLGTVYQDVHSIGKDLAKTLFENYGYRVIDMGVMTPLQGYIDAAKEHSADAIGMSALLVQTSNHMITVSRMLEEQGMGDTCVLVGGAPVSDRHAAYVAMAGRDDVAAMRKNVFYCATAMDGVNVMNDLLSSDDANSVFENNFQKLTKRYERAEKRSQEDKVLLETLPTREISFDAYTLPDGPWCSTEKLEISVSDFSPYINRRNLFSLNWRYGGKSKRESQGISDDSLTVLFGEWVEMVTAKKWLQPQGLFAVHPCYSEGGEVVVLDVEDHNRELFRFDFTTVIGSGKEDTVNGAHYYRPKDSGVLDAIGIQISSAGADITAQLEVFKESGDSESALFLQGLSDRLAEDVAAYMHDELRKRLSVDEKDGTRWSPGYPGMRNMVNNQRIYDLLGARERLGVEITDAGEFFPTGCTAAVISFHPAARYS